MEIFLLYENDIGVTVLTHMITIEQLNILNNTLLKKKSYFTINSSTITHKKKKVANIQNIL